MGPFLSLDVDLRPLFEGRRRIRYQPGELINDRERSRTHVVLVTSGVVRASLITQRGAQRMLYYGVTGTVLGETGCFGDVSDLPPGIRGDALSEVETLCMPQREFRAAAEARPDIVLGLLRWTTRKVACLIEQLEAASFRDTTAQVAALLHAFWVETHRPDAPEANRRLLHVTHQDVASATGRSRVSVTYALNELQELGVVELHRGRVDVADPVRLRRISEQGSRPADRDVKPGPHA
jgi:CRP-like cAMP-binding protein